MPALQAFLKFQQVIPASGPELPVVTIYLWKWLVIPAHLISPQNNAGMGLKDATVVAAQDNFR
jgi:hypothetical protein